VNDDNDEPHFHIWMARPPVKNVPSSSTIAREWLILTSEFLEIPYRRENSDFYML
jgi:hypothetical protein